MKSSFTRFVPVVLLALFSACLFPNQIGYRPQGGIKGAEVKDRVKFEVLAAYTLSFLAFCNDVFNIEDCRDGNASQANLGGLAASVLAGDLTPVEEDHYYTEESLNSCARRVAAAAGAMTLLHLNTNKECSSLIATNCVVSGSDVVQAGVVAGMIAPTYCDIEEVGRIVSFHQYNF